MRLEDLNIDIYADGANVDEMIKMLDEPYIKGFTTNPTLMKKAGVKDYCSFAKEVVSRITDYSVSFEVFSDDFEQMEKEAEALASLGKNVFVKVPVTNTKGESSQDLIKRLSDKGIRVNVTAVFTKEQIKTSVEAINEKTGGIISVFAGRIADAGVDAREHMQMAAKICHAKNNVQLLWASCREVYNILEAEKSGADIITVTNDLLKKTSNIGKDLEEYSLETVKMFYNDGRELGYSVV